MYWKYMGVAMVPVLEASEALNKEVEVVLFCLYVSLFTHALSRAFLVPEITRGHSKSKTE